MSRVTVCLSDASPAERQMLIGEYRSRLREKPPGQSDWPALWIAVNRPAAEATRDAVALWSQRDHGSQAPRGSASSRDHAAMLAPGVATFDQFAEAVLRKSGRRVRPISRLQRHRLLRRLIDQHAATGRLEYFSAVARTAGFVSQLDRFIADLKRHYEWPEQYAKRGAGKRHQELAELYSAYQQRLLEGQLYDAQGCFWAAGDELSANTALAADLAWVVIDGFSDFTVAQHRILRLLGQRCSEMVVTLPLDEECLADDGAKSDRTELFAKSLETLNKLQQDFSVTIRASQGARGQRDASWPAMAQLRRNLFRDFDRQPAEDSLSDDRIHIIEASSDDDEAKRIAHCVKKLLIAGQRPADVVVAYRGLSAVATRLQRVLDDYGIPFHLEARPSLAVAPTVRSLLRLLRVHAGDWKYRDLLHVVNDRSFVNFGRGCQNPGFSDEQEDAVRIAADVCIRRAQAPAGRQRLRDILDHWAADDAQAKLARDALGELQDVLEQLPKSAPLAHWLREAAAAAKRLGLEVDNCQEWPTLRKSLAACQQVDQWANLPVERLTATQFVETVASVAHLQNRSDAASPVGSVRIVDVETVRGLEPRHLLVAGLSESSFPAATSDWLAAVGNDLPAPATTADEMLLFYQLVTRPSQSLTLSYPALDDKAQRLQPSSYLIELEHALEGVEMRRTRLELQPGAAPSQPYSRTEQRLRAVHDAKEGRCQLLASLAAQRQTAASAQSALAGVEAIADRAQRDQFGPWEGVFPGGEAASYMSEKFGPQHLWSPSKLEGYAACPFRFFAEEALKLQPLPELTLENDPRRRGALLHRALAAAHRQLIGAEQDEFREQIVAQFLSALSKIVADLPQRGIDGALREIQRRELADWGAQLQEQTARYQQRYETLDEPPKPQYFEVQFGPEQSDNKEETDAALSTRQPFELDLGDEQILIIGQIDRIDLAQMGNRILFNVIDYKSGKKQFKLAEVVAGRQLQLPLYAMAAEALLLAKQKALAWEAGYWSVHGDGFTQRPEKLTFRTASAGQPTIAEQWKELETAMKARIAELVAGVRAAAFPVHNDNKDCTRTCHLSKLCRIGHIRSLEKQWPPGEEAP